MEGSVKPLRMWCQMVLPLVYDDSLSTYEALCKISYKLNEVITVVNSFGDDFKDYTDQQIDALRNEMNNLINKTINDVNASLNALQQKVDGQLAENKAQMNALQNYVDSELASEKAWVIKQISGLQSNINDQVKYLKDYIDSQDTILRNYIDEQIQKIIDMIPEITSPIVMNPITGKMEKLQDTLNYLTNVFRYFAFTAQDYDNEQLTAAEYDALNITAFDFDIYGLKIIHKDDRFYMRSPVTGGVVLYKDVIHWLITQHKENALTAQGYDNLELTASNYDGKGITAFDFDFNGIAA